MQLSSGQLIFCSFLAFKIHFSNSLRGVYTMLKLKLERIIQWLRRKKEKSLKIESKTRMKSSHLLICCRPTYLHSENKQLSSVTMKHSNYFTLREHSLARNRQIKVKQWRWDNRMGGKSVVENFSFKLSFMCTSHSISVRSLYHFCSHDIFSNSRIFCPCFCLNYFQIKIPVIVRSFFLLLCSFASDFLC